MAMHEPRLQTPEYPVPLTGIDKVFKRFNRNTTWVVAGLLGSVIFAALMVALQERHAQADLLTQEATQTTGDLLPEAASVAISKAMGSNEKSNPETTAGQATSVDRNLTPETNESAVQANAISGSPVQQPGSAQESIKNPHVRLRSSVHPRYIDVKTRLLALWHQSLRHEKLAAGRCSRTQTNRNLRLPQYRAHPRMEMLRQYIGAPELDGDTGASD